MKLKDFAEKRQVEHVSSSVEPSIPFIHMLFFYWATLKTSYSKKIKNEELSFEINNLSETLQTNASMVENSQS